MRQSVFYLMKNKTYIITISILLLLLALSAPVNRLLAACGIVNVTNIGNMSEAESSAENPILSAIEKGKSTLENIYTNYLPFYNEVVMISGEVDYAISDAVQSLFAGEKSSAPSASETLSGLRKR